MEDIKQRLKFDDLTVRTRLVQKLVQTIKNKTNNEMIKASSKQIPELTLLWESCLSESPNTTNFVIQGIVHLVSNKYIDVQYALNKLLGSISTSNNISVIVKGISKIVIFHHKQNRSNSQSVYSLHHPKHPFISVLDKNKDFLPLILENIADAISDGNTEGFQAMEPIISYLLYNPTPKSNYSKVLILEMLLDSIDNEPKVAFCVLRCIPHLQIETSEQVSEASLLIIKAKKVFDSMECSENERFFISELFLLSSVALSERCFSLGQDPSRLLNIAIQISSSINKDKCSSYVNMCLVLIAITLKSATGIHIEKLLSIAMMLLEFNQLSQTVMSFLAFSVIQIFPEPSILMFSQIEKSCASQLLEKLKQCFLTYSEEYVSQCQNEESLPKSDENNSDKFLFESFSFSVQSSSCCAQFAQQLDNLNWPSKQDWLKSLKKHVNLCDKQENLDVVFSTVTALFISCPDDPKLLSSCLDTVEAILQKNDFLSTRLFSLLLYKLSILKTPESKFVVFAFLPKSAAHKYAIPPVINMLTQMSKEPELKAVTIHLMFELWKKHDRVFSYFHNMLLDSNKTMPKDTNFNEILITKAATIKEICFIEPEKHGSDFLVILSKIFNESNDEDSSPAACLALEGVINLCKAEIIDLRSTWKLLGPKLNKDKRVSVTCQMYKLLSLIPDLNVKSPEFDTFMKEIVAKIWKQISSNSLVPDTEKEAYKTLAKFPFDCYELKQLPSAAKTNLELPVSMKATPFEMGKSPEDVLTYIPGYCFVDLMKSIHDETILAGYSELLSSIIEQEVSAFPRSVYSKRKQHQKRQTTNEALLKVPQVLCTQIEARKSPALQKNIAVGLLLCYEPPLEYGKDGEPIKRSVVCQYKFYEQVLSVLLNEVNVDSTDWQRSLLLPEAWGSFMERAFFTYDEARKTELELQRNLGQLDVSTEEFNCRCKTTWLWVRDRILNLIKTSVKNAPTSHANAIFAVSGLVRAVNKFHSSLDEDSKTLSDDAENFTKHDTFVAECTETILCAMQQEYKNKGKVHSWLLTVNFVTFIHIYFNCINI